MFAFFDQIIGYIELIWNFVLSFFKALGFAISALVSSITIPTTLIVYLPTFLGASVSIVIGVYLVKFLLGR